jgi:hypothetical protein
MDCAVQRAAHELLCARFVEAVAPFAVQPLSVPDSNVPLLRRLVIGAETAEAQNAAATKTSGAADGRRLHLDTIDFRAS